MTSMRQALMGAIKVLACTFAVVLAACLAAGCSAEGGQAASSNAESAVAAEAETVDVTDSVGRTVAVPVRCERIAALDSFAGEALVMAGAGPLMVAAPNGVASDVVLQRIYPDLSTVPAPMSGGTVNIESLWSLHPDVVLVKQSLYSSSDEVAKLDKLGIPYVVVAYDTIEEQIAALELIGSLLPDEQAQRMAAIVDVYRTSVQRVEACVSSIPDDEKLRVYHSINQAVITDGAQSIGADWITRTGAINVSAIESPTTTGRTYQATLEQVFLWDPDVVICNDATTCDYLLADSKWEGLRAVMNGDVYAIPIGATRWGQPGSVETWLAMMWLGATVYPEYFNDIDLHAEVVAFYETVLGVEVDDDLYSQMLSGKGMRKRPTENSS